jgi:hypothetical protein
VHHGLVTISFSLVEPRSPLHALARTTLKEEAAMGFGKGALLWLLGIPIPVIILLALFWHH